MKKILIIVSLMLLASCTANNQVDITPVSPQPEDSVTIEEQNVVDPVSEESDTVDVWDIWVDDETNNLLPISNISSLSLDERASFDCEAEYFEKDDDKYSQCAEIRGVASQESLSISKEITEKSLEFTIKECSNVVNEKFKDVSAQPPIPGLPDIATFIQSEIQKCEIGYAILNNDCSLIENTDTQALCETEKQQVEQFNILKRSYEVYGTFDTFEFLKKMR